MPGVASRVLRSTVAPLAIYGALSLAFFGRALLAHGDRDYLGLRYDPQIFIWSLGWWPHAILEGENPFVTHAMWPVTGLNLAWVTAVPLLALAAAPLTLLAGPAFSYNVVAVALPALAAWTAFLLCRYLTGSWWASLAGGYLFGFSAYMLGHLTAGHANLTSVFLVPLVALLVLRYVDDRSSGSGLALGLGVVLGAQLYLSTEVFATLTLALAVSLVVAFALVPGVRARLRRAVGPLLGAYAVGCALAAPVLVYAFSDFRTEPINDAELFGAELRDVVDPTQTAVAVSDRPAELSRDLLNELAENGAYLGLPLLVVLAWFAWDRRRRPSGRLLVALLALGVVAELGVAVRAGGRELPLPWALAEKLPALDNVLPVRFSMYVALGAAVVASLWAASPRPSAWIRAALLGASVLSLVPAVTADLWDTTPTRPAFFSDGLYRDCFRADENVLVVDAAAIDATLWQAEADYAFRIANGSLSPELPEGIPDPDVARSVLYNVIPEGGGEAVVRLARGLEATVILLDPEHYWWGPALEDAGLEPVEIGGVRLYHLRPPAPGCRG